MEDDLSAPVLSRPESLAELIDNISPTIYDSLKSAIELGKWPDGSRLSSEQVDKPGVSNQAINHPGHATEIIKVTAQVLGGVTDK